MSAAPSEADLAVLAGRLVTGRYRAWRPEHGVPIRSTVGAPKFWTGPQLIHLKLITPYGLLDPAIDDATAERRYRSRLDDRAGKVVAVLAGIARAHPGRSVVVLCFENVHAGDVCHRRWLAEWMADRFGIKVDEVDPSRPTA